MIPLEPWFRTVTKMVVTEADWLNEEAPGPVATAWFDNLSPGLEIANISNVVAIGRSINVFENAFFIA